MFEAISDDELRAEHARVDWAAAGLGDPQTWSTELRSGADLVWGTQFPAALFWGSDLVMLYNSAYAAMIGDKHPAALGERVRDVFPEAWDDIEPLFAHVLAGRGATFVDDSLLPLDRRGFLEECWFTYSYSPLHSPAGEVLGVVDLTAETTRQVLDHRRWALLASLNQALADVDDPGHLRERALAVLRTAPDDLRDVQLDLAGTSPAGPGVVELTDDLDPGRPCPQRVRLPLSAAGAMGGPGAPDDASRPAGTAPELVVGLSERLPFDTAYRDFLGLVASSVGQALVRLHSREVERRALVAERGLSEALQRSLLTAPAVTAPLEVAVRYRPAAARAQVGGDWYDAFTLPSGESVVVVGDVSGHDRRAAASMAQLRNLLRGTVLAQGARDGAVRPSGVLAALDRAIAQLELETLATAVVVCLDPVHDGAPVGLSWSSAGHPPPVLVDATGDAHLLDDAPDVLLGLDPTTPRTEHTAQLHPGTALLLYTDGLVERRDEPLQEGLDRLVRVAEATAGAPTGLWCDAVLTGAEPSDEDDVALLVVHWAQATEVPTGSLAADEDEPVVSAA